MPHLPTQQLRSYVDSRGRSIACVRLSRREMFAELLLSDYERIVAAGHVSPWHLNSNGQGNYYVRVHLPEFGETNASRLVANALPGQRVSYADGNPLNLRPENLVTGTGWAKQHSAAMMEPPEFPDMAADGAVAKRRNLQPRAAGLSGDAADARQVVAGASL